MALFIAGLLALSPINAAAAASTQHTIEDPPHHIGTPSNETKINISQIQNTLTSGLSFILPRSLNAHSTKELSLWGLYGILRIDPALSMTQTISSQTTDTLFLRYHNELISKYALPRSDHQTEWVRLIINIIEKGVSHSPLLEEAGNNKIISYFFANLFHHLDPYSRYIDPSIPEVSNTPHGDTCSVGISLNRHKNISYPKISAINTNGSAWEQGISIGQTLIALNGHNVRHVPLNILNHWLTGPPGSRVIITLRSSSSGRLQTFALERMDIPKETVFRSYYGRFPVLRITQFSDHTAEEIGQYLSSFTSSATSQEGDFSDPSSEIHLPGLILDLRDNHGGVLQQAVVTAALVLNHGVVTSTKGRFPAANRLWTIRGGDLTNNTPIAILVNGQTASSAEVLAAALADHHRAVIIGSSTYGKGLVQVMGHLPNRAQLFVSWGHNIAPLGWPIQTLGVFPQLCTTQSNVLTQLSSLKRGISLEKENIFRARSQRSSVSPETVKDIRSKCPASNNNTPEDIRIASDLLSSLPAYQTALYSVPQYLPSVHEASP